MTSSSSAKVTGGSCAGSRCESSSVLHTQRLLDRAARWFLTERPPQILDVAGEGELFTDPVRQLQDALRDLLCSRQRAAVAAHTAKLVDNGCDPQLAARVETLLHAIGLLDVVDATTGSDDRHWLDDPLGDTGRT